MITGGVKSAFGEENATYQEVRLSDHYERFRKNKGPNYWNRQDILNDITENVLHALDEDHDRGCRQGLKIDHTPLELRVDQHHDLRLSVVLHDTTHVLPSQC